jgi:hypothetical protein
LRLLGKYVDFTRPFRDHLSALLGLGSSGWLAASDFNETAPSSTALGSPNQNVELAPNDLLLSLFKVLHIRTYLIVFIFF